MLVAAHAGAALLEHVGAADVVAERGRGGQLGAGGLSVVVKQVGPDGPQQQLGQRACGCADGVDDGAALLVFVMAQQGS